MRALRLTLVTLGFLLLSGAALLGVGLSAVSLYASASFGRESVASWVIGFLDRSLAGRFELGGVTVLPTGGVEIRRLRVFDPSERLVLEVDRARIAVDVTRLGSRVIGLSIELDGPAILLEEEEDGGISLARALAPSQPSAPEAAPDGGTRFTVRVSLLTVRGGAIWWTDSADATRLEVHDLDVDARGGFGPLEADLDLRLGAAMSVPFTAPISLEVKASQRRDALVLSVLRAALGATAVSAVGDGDRAKRTGRLAVTRLSLDRGQTRTFAPAAGAGRDLAALAYVESDGTQATAALTVTPAGEEGSMRAAVAVRLADLSGGILAAGLDLALSGLDPARLLDGLPEGALTLTARGGASGTKLEDLRGRLEVHIAPSTVRGVALGPGELRASADRGTFEVQELTLTGPGFTVDASGRWRRHAAVAGRLVLDAGDLVLATGAAERLLGEPVIPASGRLRVEATLTGTGQAPELAATLSSPALSAVGLSARNLAARLQAAGPASALRADVDLLIESLRGGGGEAVRLVVVKGKLAEGAATLDGVASVPSLSGASMALSARARLGARNETLLVTELGLGWPGVRWALTAPTTVQLAGPSLDRLELASGDQRLAVEGGLTGKALDAKLATTRLDLATLPSGLLPERAAGRVTLEARARGTVARPDVTARFSLEDGAVAWLEGLRAGGEAGWDGTRRRMRLAVEVERKAGGRIEVRGDVPVPLAARPAEALALHATGEALPLYEALSAARLDLPLDGKVGLDLTLTGTVGEPSFTGSATLGDGAWDDLYPVDLTLGAEAPGERLRMRMGLVVDGRRALAVDAELPFDLGNALARPEGVPDALLAAPLEGQADVPGFALEAVAGAVGVPRDLTGVLTARAVIGGTLAAPRGTVTASVSGLAVAGYKDLAGQIEVKLLGRQVDFTAGASIAGAELLRATASVASAPEELAAAGALARVQVQLVAEVPRLDLATASSQVVVLAGTVAGRFEVEGTPRAPVARLRFDGVDLAVEGHPLGALVATAAYADGRTTAELALRPRSGGVLTANGTLTARFGLGVETDLRVAPLDARLGADALDLGFLPALAPGVVREARGTLAGEVIAKGPLSRPRPKGRLTVDGAHLALSQYGEWNNITLDVGVDDDALELKKLEARRGKGRFEGRGSVRGLANPEAVVEGTARFVGLTVARSGMDLATLDLGLQVTGIYRSTGADLEVRVPGGTIGLPKRIPRKLQTLEQRTDIAVGRIRERRRPPGPKPTPGVMASSVLVPFRLLVHLIVPGGLMVKGADPRVNVELKADVTYELAGEEEYATGEVEVVRGFVEPIGGRVFEVTRGLVQFTGGPPTAAMVDVEARWESAEGTKVTVLVAGPALDPQIRLSSQPSFDESQIALLIATGRTELKRGSGEVGSLSTREAGYAAASAVVTTAFKGLLADKLPIDSISVDANSVRAGTYLPNSKIYVGYAYRFNADLERGQNQNEVSVEYQISPRWTLESRYGDGQSGSASLIWSRDY